MIRSPSLLWGPRGEYDSEFIMRGRGEDKDALGDALLCRLPMLRWDYAYLILQQAYARYAFEKNS